MPEVHLLRFQRVVTEVNDGLDRKVLSDGEGGLEAAHEAEIRNDRVSPVKPAGGNHRAGAFAFIGDITVRPGRELEAHGVAIAAVVHVIVGIILPIDIPVVVGLLPPEEYIAAVDQDPVLQFMPSSVSTS